MSKHENKFLDNLKKGDKVYLAVFPRGYGDAWLGEVEFQGKTMNTERVLWDEPRCIPSYINEYYYTVRFKDGNKTFTIRLQDHGWCSENHLDATAIDLSATDMLMDDFHLRDLYMTTDIVKFKQFVNEEGLVQTAIKAMEKKKASIEMQLDKLYKYDSSTLAQ
jgi:hypothetical protein